MWHPPVSLSPEKVPTVYCFFGKCFKFSKWVFSHMIQVLFKLAFFALGPRFSDSACDLFKSGFSMLYSSIVFLDVIAIVFQTSAFRGLISLRQGLTIQLSVVQHKPLTPWYFCFPSRLCFTLLEQVLFCFVLFFGNVVSLPLLSISMLSFLSFAIESLCIPFSSLFQNKLLHMQLYIGCNHGRKEFMIF